MKNAMAQDETIKGAKAIWYGDEAVYTGESEFLHGATCYAIELIEGHLKGEIRWTYKAPSHFEVA